MLPVCQLSATLNKIISCLITLMAWQLWLATAAQAQSVTSHSHVIVIAFENHSYENVAGNTTDMPYFNSIIANYGLATNFYANVHGSMANYYWMTMGTSQCSTAGPPYDGLPTCQDGTLITADKTNIVTVLNNNRLSWKSYQENLRQAGEIAEGDSLPGDCVSNPNEGLYVPRHNPFSYFAESRNGVPADATCTSSPSALLPCPNASLQGCNVVPYGDFQADLNANNLPNLSFITPNTIDDAHDGDYFVGLQAADQWMSTNVGAILNSPYFQPGGDGLLIIWWDEGDLSGDDNCSAGNPGADPESGIACGGHIAVMVAAPDAKTNFQSTTYYQHPSVLRTVLEALGVQSGFPGASAGAPDMAEFFNSGVQVTVSTPANGATVSSPVHIEASATPSPGQTISGWHIYVDDVDSFSAGPVSSITADLPMNSGVHTVVVRAWDTSAIETFGDQTLTLTVP